MVQVFACRMSHTQDGQAAVDPNVDASSTYINPMGFTSENASVAWMIEKERQQLAVESHAKAAATAAAAAQKEYWWKQLSPQGLQALLAEEAAHGWGGFWDKGEWIVTGQCSIKEKVVTDKGKAHKRQYWQVRFKKPIPRTNPPQRTIHYSFDRHGQHGALHLAQRHRPPAEYLR